jgi:hypothetical protein
VVGGAEDARRAPEARWICGRSVFREQGRRGHRPSAAVELGAERHAISVLLKPTKQSLLVPPLESHMRRYDALVAFCAPKARRSLQRLAAQNHWPKLVVRELPKPGPAASV